jgi:hypothetical protein
MRYTARDGMAILVAEDAANPEGLLGCVEVSIQTGKVRFPSILSIPRPMNIDLPPVITALLKLYI